MFNTAADWGFYTVPQLGCRGRRIFWPRGRMVGGSGALNAMIYIRGLPSDYDGWARLGCPNWSWGDVLPVFKMSEDNQRLGNDPLHGAGGPLHVSDPAYVDRGERMWIEAAQAAGHKLNADFNGTEQEGCGFFQFVIKDGERWGTGKSYLRPALDRPNLTVKTGILITRIVIEKGRAVGVEYLEMGRPGVAHASSEIVLSCGAIGSPHLLMLSGVGPADELKAAGSRPFMTCRASARTCRTTSTSRSPSAPTRRSASARLPRRNGRKSLAAWQGAPRSGLRTSAWVAAGAHVRSRPDVEPDLQLYGAMSPHRDYARFLHSGSGVALHATLQRPESRGEISLRSADPIEAPDIDPRYFVSDPSGGDIATLIEGVRVNRRIAAQSPLKEILTEELAPSGEAQSDDEIAYYIRGHCTTLYHPSSTCRMGVDAKAVVDPSSMKVYGLEGLRIADASVIPRMISGNLQTPTIMIAERAAQMILADS